MPHGAVRRSSLVARISYSVCRIAYIVFAPHQLVVPSTKKTRRFGAGQLVRDLRCAPRFSTIDGCDGSFVNLVNVVKWLNWIKWLNGNWFLVHGS